jgi:arsenite methyltransferase
MTSGVTALELREAVRKTFDRVADAPDETYRFAVGQTLAEEVGYPREVLSAFRPAVKTFTGLAYLHPHINLRGGEHVLDLGCGGGLDSLIAARTVGAAGAPGAAVGLDVAEAMVNRARTAADGLGMQSVTFERGEAEAMPFAPATFDAVLVNGIFNLCPEKLPVAREIYRVLKQGGRAVIAEITFTEPLPEHEVRTVDDWFR